MDPITHAISGALLATSAAPRQHSRAAALIGAIAGMAPDLDVFIRSAQDPLLNIEYHRHFSHALAFTPIGALLVTLPFFLLFRRRLSFGWIYLFCFLGYIQGGLIDAATSYGTQLWWPFADTRVAWNIVAIIDPLYTLPLLVLLMIAVIKKQPRWAWVGIAWGLLYLAMGVVQRDRAEAAITTLAHERGHTPTKLTVKPSVFNNILFRGIYRDSDTYYVDAVRINWLGEVVIYPGDSTPAIDLEVLLASLPEDSRLHRDLQRFNHFSDGYLHHDPVRAGVIGDLRYALIPNTINALWGITPDFEDPDAPTPFDTFREVTPEKRAAFLMQLRGTYPSVENP